jgi:hypothetical protein
MLPQAPLPIAEPAPPPACLLGSGSPCTWTHHGYKHFPARGVTREHTRHGPAKYAGRSEVEVRTLETATVREPELRGGDPGSGKVEYLRDMNALIGWDEGVDAHLSFVECSGGTLAGRSFHGRPMHRGNRAVRELRMQRLR